MENKNQKLEYEDDDGYYMELRRQILLLTSDDDENEDFQKQSKVSNSIVDSKRRSYSFHGSYNYFSWGEGDIINNNSVPTWLLNLWARSGNGTGVFIPQILKPTRRCKPSGKMNNRKTGIYRAKDQLRC